MNKLKLFIIALSMSFMVVAPVAQTVFAYDGPFSKACESDEAKKSSLCKDNAAADPDPIYGPNGIINKVANIIAIVAGLAAVVIIMISGLKIITSSGEPQKITDARNAIIYASIGLVVIALSRVIVGFIVGLI